MNRVVLRLLLNRLASGALTLLIVSAIVFFATGLLPGDVTEAILGQAATDEVVKAMRASMGLDQPAIIRYFTWLKGLLSGDLGMSLVNRLSVSALIADRLGNSMILAGLAAAVTVPLALLLGITTAIWRGSRYDRATNIAAVSLVSVPEFLIATIAVILLAVELQWFPALSKPDFSSPAAAFDAFFLPVLTLSCGMMAQMTRMTRAALLGVLDSAYVEMARLKGVTATRLVLRHALPNAAAPIVNAVALSLSSLIGGVIIVEVIFNYPGLAKLMVDAVSTRDMPLIQACAMLSCLGYMVLVLIADLWTILSNPRLRHP
ncbi:ABC transporter permease [Acetobacteraceae bacterium H6797]|nr:ABC transporter permease [Acetobacteraceae bacterium H6797]